MSDKNIHQVTEAEFAALVLTRSDCGSCFTYERQIRDMLAQGTLWGVHVIGKLVLDQSGAGRFKRDNPWVKEVPVLPFTVLYRRGEQVDSFCTTHGSYLMDRISRVQSSRSLGATRTGSGRGSARKRAAG